MKKIICLAVGLLALHLAPVFGQTSSTIVNSVLFNNQHASPLTKFNLDFPGGTPAALVAAIEKATGKPLNVIINDEDADTKLPPLKMDNVDAAQLFDALENASVKRELARNNVGGYESYSWAYSFRTTGTPTDNSIWYFHSDKPAVILKTPVQKVIKFYPLAPYLNSGLTVDDITTAIQTGWKMSGDNSPPELNYHKETKLLMAYGEPDKLKVIDDVLSALQPKPPTYQEVFDQMAVENLKRVYTNSAVTPIDPNTGLPIVKDKSPAEKTGK